MKRQLLIRSALCAAMMGFAGSAMAAGEMTPTTSNAKEEARESQTGMDAGTKSHAAIGSEVINAEGETVGEIAAVRGNQAILSVGGFLGIGERNVAVDWDKLQRTGSGADAKYRLSMSRTDLEALPPFAIEESQQDQDNSVGVREPKRGSTRGYVPAPN